MMKQRWFRYAFAMLIGLATGWTCHALFTGDPPSDSIRETGRTEQSQHELGSEPVPTIETVLELERQLRDKDLANQELDEKLRRSHERIREVLANVEIMGTPEYYRSALSALFAEPGEFIDALELINRGANSPDDLVRVVALKYMTALCQTESDAIDCNRVEVLAALPSPVVDEAASFLAQRMTPELKNQLESSYFSEPFPLNWGTALTLSMAGYGDCLEFWTEDLLRSVGESPPTKTTLAAIRGLKDQPWELSGEVILALVHGQDARLRAAAIPILVDADSTTAEELLRQLAEDPHPVVSQSALAALNSSDSR